MPDDTTATTDDGTEGEQDVSETSTPTIPAPALTPAITPTLRGAEPESPPEPEPQPQQDASAADVANSPPEAPEPTTEPTPEPSIGAAPAEVRENTTPMAPSKSWALSLLALARAKMQFKKQKKLDEIMALAGQRRVVVSRDIELLLHVSAATATRYLEALVKAGRLHPSGAFRHTKYEVVG